MDLTLTTELKAVNMMLSLLGEQPIVSLPSTYFFAQMAQTKLAQVSRVVQSQGLHCNTEEDVTLTRGVGGEITVPTNALYVDASLPSQDVVVRDGKLYDRVNHTAVFTQNVQCDITYLLDFDELPDTVRYYIAVRAAREFQRDTVGSDALHGFSQEEELRAWAEVQRQEMRQADRNFAFTSPASKILQRRV